MSASNNDNSESISWEIANRDYLMRSLELVQYYLQVDLQNLDEDFHEVKIKSLADKVEKAKSLLPSPSALDRLCELFDLSLFERNVILLCAGVELDSEFAKAISSSDGDSQQHAPTFSLALSKLPVAVWESLAPSAPLRYWRMIEVGGGSALTASPLRLDERILHYLTGLQYFDERLTEMMNPVFQTHRLSPSQEILAERVTQAYLNAEVPIVTQLCGDDIAEKHLIASAASSMLGLSLWSVDMSMLPDSNKDLSEAQRLCDREALLGGAALLFDFDHVEDKPSNDARFERFIDQIGGFRMLMSRQRKSMPRLHMLTFDVKKPLHSEQRLMWKSVWQGLTGSDAEVPAADISKLAYQFDIGASAISTVSADALVRLQEGRAGEQSDSEDAVYSDSEVMEALWESSRAQARPRLDDLVQRIEPVAHWNDLILPDQQLQVLRDIAMQMENRSQVYGDWGFSSKGDRGLGIAALFAGNSGTGKTFAAEVLANHLSLDLYRIDLSSVINKYIGETEKNLGRVFAIAEEGGAILLFDEADALFGKRSEVKDSHDRHANIEVSYLLQRMESYRGLAILTTNLKENLDNAFLRRLRFIAQFPFPNAEERARIWATVFPSEMSMEGVDMDKLGQLNVSGGTIRNIALNAAFNASEDGGVLKMRHVLKASHSEYFKMEKTLTESEIRGWG